jgi:hypothetical protein
MSTQVDEDSDSSESDSEDTESRKGHQKKPRKALNISKKMKTSSKPSFWKDMFTNFYHSTHLLKSIEGRAAKVHSFMRGLSMSTCYPFSPFTESASTSMFDDLDASYSGASEFYREAYKQFETIVCVEFTPHIQSRLPSPHPHPPRKNDLVEHCFSLAVLTYLSHSSYTF